MKDGKEFLEKCAEYFGGFHNDNVMKMIANELRYIKPADYNKIFRELVSSLPATFKPDYKAFREAVNKCNIVFLDSEQMEKICPVCGTLNCYHGMQPACPRCKYHKDDGDPAEYSKFWNQWRNGQIKPIDVQKILKEIKDGR